MPFATSLPVLVVAVVIAGLIMYAIRILREYERAVVFQLGRFWRVKGPGLVIIVPLVQQMVRISLRTVVHDVPPQDLITRDNVTVKVNAVIYYRVIEPDKAVIQVENYQIATSQLAQTTLRSVLGQHQLDELLAERDKLNAHIQRILDEHTNAWGIKVLNVEIKHVDLDPTMVRAIAKQAEAERIRRAKVINAEGEHQAAERLRLAGDILARRAEAIQLRYIGAIQDLAGERTTTVVLPLPLDLIRGRIGADGDARPPRAIPTRPAPHKRRRRHDHERRHAVDDRRRRDPAHRAPARAPRRRGRPVPRHPALGEPAGQGQADRAPVPEPRR